MNQKKSKTQSQKTNKHAMDLILIVIGITLAVFTSTMIVVFCLYQSVPDTLITCVFAALTGECGIMGWIKNNKERQETRRWELEDRKLNRMQSLTESEADSDE